MNTTNMTGIVNFKVDAQKAEPSWVQDLMQSAVDNSKEMPNALRFQCRIALDAREVFSTFRTEDGTSYRLHPRSRPQFGKNIKGNPYLTVTVQRAGDGKAFTLTWEGDDVPMTMKRVAVNHDVGKAIRAQSIPLDLARAQVSTPASGRNIREYADLSDAEKALRAGRDAGFRKAKAAYKTKAKARPKGKHVCARLTEHDLTPA